MKQVVPSICHDCGYTRDVELDVGVLVRSRRLDASMMSRVRNIFTSVAIEGNSAASDQQAE